MKKILLTSLLLFCFFGNTSASSLDEEYSKFKNNGDYTYQGKNISISSTFNYYLDDFLKSGYKPSENEIKKSEKINDILIKLNKTTKGKEKVDKIYSILEKLINDSNSNLIGSKGYLLYSIYDNITELKEKELFTSEINQINNEIKQEKEYYNKIQSEKLNLLNNNNYKIKLTAKEKDLNNTKIIFEIERNGDKFNVFQYYQDLDTGKIHKGIYYDDYSASFYGGRIGYDDPFKYLQIREVHYRYPNIKVDIQSTTYGLPLIITGGNIKGYYAYPDIDYYFNIEIISTNKLEKECNIRGTIKDDEKIYFTKKSEKFNDTWYDFKCFETIEEAEKEGYKLNYSEGLNK